VISLRRGFGKKNVPVSESITGAGKRFFNSLLKGQQGGEDIFKNNLM